MIRQGRLEWRAEVPATDLSALKVGQTVEVEISHYTSKAGKVSAVVKRYVSPSEAPAAASTPAAKQAVKAATRKQLVKTAADDDIPF